MATSSDPSFLSDSLGLAGSALNIFRSGVSDATKASIGLAGTLLSGSQNLSDYSNALITNTELFNNRLGKVINGLVQFAEGSLQEYQALSGIGASFGKEMSQIKIAAAELGMSVEDMTSLFKQNASSLRAFGGTTDMAISRFRQFSSGVLDSELGTQLRRLGYTAGDINETLLTYQEIAEQDGNMNRRSEAQRAASAAQFAQQLDGLSKLTGKQREQLADEMKQARRRGDIQAYLIGKTADEQAAFTSKYTELVNTMGQDAADAFADLAIRGAPTTEATRNAIVAMGPAAEEMMNAANQFNSGNISGFNDAIAQAQGATLDYLKTDEARQAAMLGGMSNISSAFGNLYEGTYDLGNAVEGAAGANEDSASVIQDLQTQITQEQARQMEQTNGLLDRTIQMQEAVRDMTIMATTEALPRLEEMAVRGIDMFLEKLPSSEQIAREIGGAINNLFNTAEGSIYGGDVGQLFTDLGNQQVDTTSAVGQAAQDIGAAVTGAGTETTDALAAEAERQRAAEEAMAARQEQAQAALDEANSALTDAVSQREAAAAAAEQATAHVAELTRNGFDSQDPVVRAAQEEATRAAAEAARASEIATATQRVVSSLGHTARTGTLRGFAEGGTIKANEIGMVGEAGPEFMAGPANVMSAKTSMGVMQNLMKGIGNLESKVQEGNRFAQNQVSNSNNNSNSMSNMSDSKLDAMISLLSQLVNVESTAAHTASRTFRATKGLQGNMLKGLGA